MPLHVRPTLRSENLSLTEALEFRKREKMVKCDFKILLGVTLLRLGRTNSLIFLNGVEKERGMHK